VQSHVLRNPGQQALNRRRGVLFANSPFGGGTSSAFGGWFRSSSTGRCTKLGPRDGGRRRAVFEREPHAAGLAHINHIGALPGSRQFHDADESGCKNEPAQIPLGARRRLDHRVLRRNLDYSLIIIRKMAWAKRRSTLQLVGMKRLSPQEFFSAAMDHARFPCRIGEVSTG
jgi:hypothetical protein